MYSYIINETNGQDVLKHNSRGKVLIRQHFLHPLPRPLFEPTLASVAKENHVINRTPVVMLKVLVNQRHHFG